MFDGILFAVMLLTLAIAAVFTWTVIDQIQTTNTQLGMGLNDSILQSGKNSLQVFDAAGAIVVVILGLGVIYTSFLIRSHPAFAVVALILLGFQIMVSAILNNVYVQFVNSNSSIASAADNFTLIALIITNLPLITMLMSGLALLFAFGKPANQQGEF